HRARHMPRRFLSRPDARTLAHEVLVRVETTAAFADVLVADRIAGAALAARDASLFSRLVYGTLAWQGRLDHRLRGFLRMPLDRLAPPGRAALRLGGSPPSVLGPVPAPPAVDTGRPP